MLNKTLLSLACAAWLTGQANAVEIVSSLSDDLTEQLQEDYGVREEAILLRKLEAQVRSRLAKKNIEIASLELVLEDAAPTKPTFKQMSDKPGLDYMRSISLGGARITARAFDEDGALIHETTYKWFENDITMAVGAGTWTDANRAFNRFSFRLVRELSEKTR